MATRRTWVASRGIADMGARRFRHAGEAPTSANPTPPPGSSSAACSSVAHCTATSPGSNRPAAATTRSGPASSRGGSRYHAERSSAGCWVPLRQLPITGVLAGSRSNGSRARDPFTPAAAVVPPSVPASLSVTSLSGVSAKLVAVPGPPITSSADTSLGIPLGPNPSEVPAPSASPTGTPTGISTPVLGLSSTSTSSAIPHVLPVSASRFDRPTLHAGYWSIMANVSDSTSKTTTSHVAIANGDWMIRRHRKAPCPVRGGVVAGEVEPRGQQQRQHQQPEKEGAEAEPPLRELV